MNRADVIEQNRARLAAKPNVERYADREYYRNEPQTPVELAVGQRVKLHLDSRQRWWTVRGLTADTVVLTRQRDFRPRGERVYTVIDWRAGVRGPVNVIGQGWDVSTDERCQELAEMVRSGNWDISQRNWVPIDLNIEGSAS